MLISFELQSYPSLLAGRDLLDQIQAGLPGVCLLHRTAHGGVLLHISCAALPIMSVLGCCWPPVTAAIGSASAAPPTKTAPPNKATITAVRMNIFMRNLQKRRRYEWRTPRRLDKNQETRVAIKAIRYRHLLWKSRASLVLFNHAGLSFQEPDLPAALLSNRISDQYAQS